MDDPRHVPLYSIPECARYLGLPVSTVRGWLTKPGLGRHGHGGPKVLPAGSDPTALSFTNLVEIFVLSSMLRSRPAAERTRNKGGVGEFVGDRSLADRKYSSAGFCLERVEHDAAGAPVRFYPFTRGYGRDDPKLVVIDPAVKFGRPVITGTGVPTEVIAKLIKAGESILDLAEDYRVEPAHIEEAVRYELSG